jgi:uncharacterized protein
MRAALLDSDVRRVVDEQRLCFVATVNADGTPNLSPKGSIRVWDEQRLLFGDFRSPATIGNLEARPAVEINVVDPISRKGYRFRGTARVLRSGEERERAAAFLEEAGVPDGFGPVVVVDVALVSAVISPAYDAGATEAEIRARWLARRNEAPGA